MTYVRLADVVTLAARISGIPAWEIVGDSRRMPLPGIRACIIRIGRDAGHSYPKIGIVMNRDHSTLINALNKLDIYLRRDGLPAFNEALRAAVAAERPFVSKLAAPIVLPPAPMKVGKSGGSKVNFQALPKSKPRNCFRVTDSEEPDDGHVFHAAIASGSSALVRAILEARS